MPWKHNLQQQSSIILESISTGMRHRCALSPSEMFRLYRILDSASDAAVLCLLDPFRHHKTETINCTHAGQELLSLGAEYPSPKGYNLFNCGRIIYAPKGERLRTQLLNVAFGSQVARQGWLCLRRARMGTVRCSPSRMSLQGRLIYGPKSYH